MKSSFIISINKIFVLVLVFLSLTLFSQKLKIKKNVLSIDKVETVIVEKLGSDFIYKDLSTKNTILTATLKNQKISEGVSKSWVVVTNSDESISTEIPYEILKFSMNVRKIMSTLFIRKYKLFSKGSVNWEDINTFFAKIRPSISDEVNSLLKDRVDFEKKLNSYEITIDMKRALIFSGKAPYDVTRRSVDSDYTTAENYIGSFIISQNPNSSLRNINYVNIYDSDKVNVARADFSGKLVKVDYPIAKKTYNYTSSIDPFSTRNEEEYKRKLVKELVQHCFHNGVHLGYQIRKQVDANNQAKIDEYNKAVKESGNFYAKPGYVINEEGLRKEGEISIEFIKINDPRERDNITYLLGDGSEDYATSVLLTYKVLRDKLYKLKYNGKKYKFKLKEDEGKKFILNILDCDDSKLREEITSYFWSKSGNNLDHFYKTKHKNYRARNNNKFCVVVDGEERCYIGVKLKASPFIVSENALELKLPKYRYYQLVFENDKCKILYNYPEKKYIIKLNSQSKAYQFISNKPIDNNKELIKYLGKDLPSEFINKDYTKKETAIEVARFLEN